MLTSRYFKPARKPADGSALLLPPPLAASASRRVRFNEVDALGVVWHGHYASYFEDARTAFGERYGVDYQLMRDSGVVTPVKQMRVDYEAPLRFGQEFDIMAVLFWSEAARLNFEYVITGEDGYSRAAVPCSFSSLWMTGGCCTPSPIFMKRSAGGGKGASYRKGAGCLPEQPETALSREHSSVDGEYLSGHIRRGGRA